MSPAKYDFKAEDFEEHDVDDEAEFDDGTEHTVDVLGDRTE